jgi:hypothetical protein
MGEKAHGSHKRLTVASMRRPRLSRGKRGCLAPPALEAWGRRQPLNHRETKVIKVGHPILSESWCSGSQEVVKGRPLGAIDAALDNLLAGARLSGIG